MQIDTDYQQWYDGIFDDQPPVFSRRAFTRGGLSKRAQFELFARLCLRTPPHGKVSDLSGAMLEKPGGMAAPVDTSGDLKCVVYLDEYAHGGDGKRLLPLAEAVKEYPDHFGTLYISVPGPPVVYRMARLGQWAFWVRQEGQSEDWRSNRRDFERVLAKVRCEEPNPIPRVLWAIDFIPSPFGLLALDFNTAPALETLGEVGSLTAAEVAEELRAAAGKNPAQLQQFP